MPKRTQDRASEEAAVKAGQPSEIQDPLAWLKEESRKADEDAARRGWTEEQRRQESFVRFLLYSAKSGFPEWPRYPFFLRDLPEATLRARAKLTKSVDEIRSKQSTLGLEEAAEVYAMHLGIELMIENMQLQRTPPRPGGPYADELCHTCRKRIEQRHRSGSNLKAVRLRFPKRSLEHERRILVRDAWRATKEHRLYTRVEFTRIAAKIAEVSEQTILHYLRGIRKTR